VLLILVGFLWGSQYIFIKVALVDLTPQAIAFFRVGLGAIFMAIVCLCFAKPKPTPVGVTRTPWWMIAIIGLLEAGIPSLLIAWGQVHIASGLVAILVGTTPLLTIGISALLLRREPARAGLFIAVIGGFLGLLLLFGFRVHFEDAIHGPAGIVILMAALCYAISLVMLGQVKGRTPQSIARDIMFYAAIPLLPIWLIWGEPGRPLPGLASGLALLYIATLGSGVVFLIYIYIIRMAGATFASLSNYIVPVVGVLLGVTLGGERLLMTDLIALAVILLALSMAHPAIIRLFGRRATSPPLM
jgi:drug/metabolite transporter (DMT)-like permease